MITFLPETFVPELSSCRVLGLSRQRVTILPGYLTALLGHMLTGFEVVLEIHLELRVAGASLIVGVL